MRKIILIIALLGATTLQATENRWKVNDSHSVQWDTSNGVLPYYDHIEMSGLRASVVYYWGVDEKKQFHMPRLGRCPNTHDLGGEGTGRKTLQGNKGSKHTEVLKYTACPSDSESPTAGT